MKIQIQPLEYSHFPVMLSEIIKFSSPSKGGTFLDCTFGGGGYSKALLKLNKSTVISLDRDNVVSKIADQIKKKHPKRFYFHQEKAFFFVCPCVPYTVHVNKRPSISPENFPTMITFCMSFTTMLLQFYKLVKRSITSKNFTFEYIMTFMNIINAID